MVALPAFAALVALACLGLVLGDALRRPAPDKVAWAVAFGLFAVAAGAEVVGGLAGWTPLLARVYYLAGAVLVVGFLALGELYLLRRSLPAVVPGVALLVAAVAGAVVFDAPVDANRLATEGWHALERGPALVALAVAINGLGTAVLVGGAGWSAWRLWRRGGRPQRAIGCALIAFGTLLVATGGTLTRLGRPEYLYLAMTAGIAAIFAGYVVARPAHRAAVHSAAVGTAQAAATSVVTANGGRNGAGDHHALGAATTPVAVGRDPGIAYVAGLVLAGEEQATAARCGGWGFPPRVGDRLDLGGARRVWALRLRLPADAQRMLDALPVATQLQVADLYWDVLAPEAVASGPPRPTPVGDGPAVVEAAGR